MGLIASRSRSRTAQIRVALVAAFTVASLGGCAVVDGSKPTSSAVPTVTSESPGPVPGAFAQLATDLIAEANTNGADPRQVTRLEEARDAGSVTYATLREALADFFSCLDAAGIDYLDNGVDESRGYPLPAYGVVAPADDAETTQRVADRCLQVHYDYLDTLYQLQPASVEAAAAPLLAKKSELLDCLAGIGIEVADSATVDELRTALLYGELGFEPEIGPEASPPPGWVSTNCAIEVGLDGY